MSEIKGEIKLEEKYVELYKAAVKAYENSYAPYSKFSVGAALLTESGKVFTGVNIENAAYGATICGERSAVSAAVTAGERKFEAIAIASSGGTAWPCGTCRQVLFEFSPNMLVITGDNEENLEALPLDELLVNGFRLEK